MTKPWIKTIIALGAFTGLLWLLSRIGWSVILIHLQQVGILGFSVLCLFGIIEACFDALALQQSVLGQVSFWPLLCLNQAGSAVNIVVASEAGEIYKATLLAQHLPGRKASSAILLWNVASRLSKPLVIFLAATIAFFGSTQGSIVAWWCLLLALFNIGIYGLIMIGLRRRWIAKSLTALSRLIPILKRTIAHAQEAEERSANFFYHHPRHYVAMIFFQMMARVAGFIVIWTACRLLHADYSLALCALIYAATELATYLIGLFPTRLGVTEGSTYLLFETLKLGGSFGAIFQVVLRIKQLAVTSFFLMAGFITRLASKTYTLEENPS